MAHKEAEASSSLHVEVEEEGARESDNRVQSPDPVISITTTYTQLNPASLVDTPMDDDTTLDMDILRSSLEPRQNQYASAIMYGCRIDFRRRIGRQQKE